MRLPTEAVKRRFDTRLLEASRVCLAAVAERVELGGENVCRGEPREITGAQRRSVWRLAIMGVGEVVGCKGFDVSEIETVALAEECEGPMFDAAVAHVGDRHLEQLEQERWAAAIACHERKRGGEVASC